MHAAQAGQARQGEVLGGLEGCAEGSGAAPQEGPKDGRGALEVERREDLRAGDEPCGHPAKGSEALRPVASSC